MPGCYRSSGELIRIKAFTPDVEVIASKQRPRRINLIGTDGKSYQFLLKGNEDLRQDERVMQLFGLINECLDNDRTTSNQGLRIVRYSVLPLSNNSGLIGWVENCDTLNQLVKKYREQKGLRLNVENKILQTKCPHYNKLPVINKVEVFTQVQEETSGQDLAKMLWLKSKTADNWVFRRSNFTKSMALMSMVGYILGLGDRHPSNLMIERQSGSVVHIDFGDCFEVTKKRAKFPEIIPFRLTRMLTTAMERSGIEGTYRTHCQRVMRVLREHSDSVMAMLEAFVYDPLMSWKLLAPDTDGAVSTAEDMEEVMGVDTVSATPKRTSIDAAKKVSIEESALEDLVADAIMVKSASVRRSSASKIEPIAAPPDDTLNIRALEVIQRIQAKLTGGDFSEKETLDEEQQVDRLIQEATSTENLCQLYQGWCPLW